MGGAVPKEVEVCLVHVMCYACVDRLCTRAAYICRIHRSLKSTIYHQALVDVRDGIASAIVGSLAV